MKRYPIVLGVAALLFATAACVPQPEVTPKVTCDQFQAIASVSPGVTFASAPQTLVLDAGSQLFGCSDSEGLGITGGTFDSFTSVFPALDCAGIGATGVGAGNITWSDGSSSTLSTSITMSGPLTAELSLEVDTGRFAGSSGSMTVNAMPIAGDCFSGITVESLEGGVLELR